MIRLYLAGPIGKQTIVEANVWRKKVEDYWIDVISKIIKSYFDNKSDKIDESKIIEDKIFDKKNEDEISKKSEDNDIKEKQIKKIAGLINKLDKKDISKLKNLLEDKE